MARRAVENKGRRVRALLIQDNKVILLKRVKKNETFFVIPGGGAEKGESDTEALVRECDEELGVEVEVGPLFLKRKFRGEWEFFYFCSVQKGRLGTGQGPEFSKLPSYEGTHRVVRVPLSRLVDIDLRPLMIKQRMSQLYQSCISVFEKRTKIERIQMGLKEKYFVKNLAVEEARQEWQGYQALKKFYPVPALLFSLKEGVRRLLVFEYERSVETKRGALLADYFARQKILNPRYNKIIALYKKVFFQTLGWDEGRAADVFFRERIKNRINKFYRKEFVALFQGREFVLHGQKIKIDLCYTLQDLRRFFAKRRKTWTVLSQGDPNDLNIGMKPVLFDFLGGGRVPLMAEFAIFFWYNLAQGSYFSPKYRRQAFAWHGALLSKKDRVGLRDNRLFHEPSLIRQQAIKKYTEKIIRPLLGKLDTFDFYEDFKHYLAMRILGVFDLRKMCLKDQALSLAYLQFFYQSSAQTMDEFLSIINVVCPKLS